MKQLVFLALTMTLTSTAFATHAYRSEDCRATSKNLALRYTGNYPVGGDYAISQLNDKSANAELLALSMDDELDQSDYASADVVFSEVQSKNLGKSKKSSDDDFDHEEWRSRKIIKMLKVTSAASQKLGIQQGESVVFVCHESTDYPNGNVEK